MRLRLRLTWRKTTRTLLILAIIIVPIVLIFVGYKFNWTGFRSKTLWDWLQLLIVPLVLAIGGFWLNQIQKSRDEKNAQQRSAVLAIDGQRESALQTYISNMSELLLKEHLREPEARGEVKTIARARTLTVALNLDPARKAILLLFLYESGLILNDIYDGIIDLQGADFSQADFTTIYEDTVRVNLQKAKLRRVILKAAKLAGANLKEANLTEAFMSRADLKGASLVEANLRRARLRAANLQYANLIKADLRETNLSHADLKYAQLSGANLKEANLKGANITPEQLDTAASLEGAIMPDGSKHS